MNVPNCRSSNLCRQASSERQVASMEITKVTGFFPPFLVVLVGNLEVGDHFTTS